MTFFDVIRTLCWPSTELTFFKIVKKQAPILPPWNFLQHWVSDSRWFCAEFPSQALFFTWKPVLFKRETWALLFVSSKIDSFSSLKPRFYELCKILTMMVFTEKESGEMSRWVPLPKFLIQKIVGSHKRCSKSLSFLTRGERREATLEERPNY